MMFRTSLVPLLAKYSFSPSSADLDARVVAKERSVVRDSEQEVAVHSGKPVFEPTRSPDATGVSRDLSFPALL
jgi:hypothetical protein